MSTATVRISGVACPRARRQGLSHQAEHRRCDVVDRHVGEPAAERGLGARRREDEDAVPVVVGLVRPVSFSKVWMPPIPTAPTERQSRSAEVDEEIGRDAVDAAVEGPRAVRLAAMVRPLGSEIASMPATRSLRTRS